MWFDGQRQPNTIYVANTSRGKDSTAMLRAIQLMGWPLDMICSVDIWFDDDTPAELPPMVAFKDEYDRKVLDWFGVPVTRLCATKRDKEPRDKESYIAGFRTSICSTTSHKESIRGTSTVSLKQSGRGARNSNTKKLTYCDIFYRQIVPKRERERAAAPTDSHRSKGTGATISNAPSSRIPESLVFMVQRGTQAGGNSIKGFPRRKAQQPSPRRPRTRGGK